MSTSKSPCPNLVELVNAFHTFDISDDQLLEMSFTELQLAVLHNDRAAIAEELLLLTPEIGIETEVFFRNHAFLRGKLEYINHLITRFATSLDPQE